MSHDSPAIDDALRPFAARAVRVSLWRSVIVSLTAIGIVIELAWIGGVDARVTMSAGVVAAIAAVVAGLFMATAARPSARDVARHLDRRGHFQNLIVTAVDCPGDGLPALVRDAARTSLQSLRPADAYPFEPPRRWRRWLMVVIGAQVLVLAILWRAPAARMPAASVSSVAQPSSASASAPEAPPARRDDAPRAGSTPAAPTATSPDGRADADTTTGPRRVVPPDVAGTTTAVSTGRGDSDRLRLAAAHAESDMLAGRIPASKRTLVARYFAAIQHARKTPR